MTPSDLLVDAFGRVRSGALAVLDGMTDEQLRHRVTTDANPIGWLVWHLARVQDDHVADVAGTTQAYDVFVDRFAVPYDPGSIGYGQTSAEVGELGASAELLAEYLEVVHRQTLAFLATLGPEDLDRVVDEGWDPPVTLGVRLLSVVNDDLQHVGQAAYVRGLLGL